MPGNYRNHSSQRQEQKKNPAWLKPTCFSLTPPLMLRHQIHILSWWNRWRKTRKPPHLKDQSSPEGYRWAPLGKELTRQKPCCPRCNNYNTDFFRASCNQNDAPLWQGFLQWSWWNFSFSKKNETSPLEKLCWAKKVEQKGAQRWSGPLLSSMMLFTCTATPLKGSTSCPRPQPRE